MFRFRVTARNFSPAIIELDAAMRAGRLRHDGNPVLEWCLGNVTGKAPIQPTASLSIPLPWHIPQDLLAIGKV
jgi:hypothetical protein